MPVVLKNLDMSNNHYDYADETLRRITDTFGKHSLTDVKEENEEPAIGQRLSNHRIGSIDAIWDTHPQRLAEAGLLRHQDNSILTEDTDSFIIGDRVWVGGTKPGQIAFIGETQFAPGEWAGIVLDQAIGKNDGSVGGTRYFQCEAKRGVFSRLTRLTRFALLGADDASICSSSFTASSTPFNNSVKRRIESPVSPTGSIKSTLRTPPPFSVSNTSLSSIPHVIDFKIGDRVIIKSTQGSKVGTVRYIGTTDFAPGEWCGVELDEPKGKNDGSVEGKKYFECAPQFGLFAPVSKVSKSPLKYKPGNCVIHTGAGNNSTVTGIKRIGSRESMASMTSSITSAASGVRRDVLKEKQQHIEQLLKEKDLDRIELIKVAAHADEVEQKLAILKVEQEQYRLETESKLKEYIDVLTKLNKDRSITLSQLDDEKRKNEDLLFKFEEAAIIKNDVEVNSNRQTLRIQDLEAQLAAERQKLHNFEGDSSKLFETEEALVEAHEEVEVLKKEIEALNKKNEDLLQKQAATAEPSNILQADLEKLTLEFKTLKEENFTIVEKLQQDISTVTLSSTEACSQLTKEIDSYVTQIQEKSDTCQKLAEEIATLRIELYENKSLTKQTQDQLNETTETESKLITTIEKLKQDLSSKIFDIETSSETIKQKENEIVELKAQIETTNLQSKNTTQEIETKLTNEIEQLKGQLNIKNDEYKVLSEKLGKVDGLFKLTTDEKQKLEAELKKAKDDFEASLLAKTVQYDKDIESKTLESNRKDMEIQNKLEETIKALALVKQLQDESINKDNLIDELKKIVSGSQKHFENEQAITSKLDKQIQALQLNVGDLQRKVTADEQLITDLTNHKLHLESDIQTLINSSGDYSEKLQELNANLKSKDDLLAITKIEFTEKVQQLEHINQEIQLQMNTIKEDAEHTKLVYEEKLQCASELEVSLRERFEKVTTKHEDAQTQMLELKRLLETTQNQIQDMKDQKSKLENELSCTKQLHDDNGLIIKQLTKDLSAKESLLSTTQVDFDEKLVVLEHLNQEQKIKIQKLLEELQQKQQCIDDNSKKYLETEELLKQFNEEARIHLENAQQRIAELQNIVVDKDLSLKMALEEKQQLDGELNKATSLSGDSHAEIQKLASDLEEQKALVVSTKVTLSETINDLQQMTEKLNDAQKANSELNEALQESVKAQENLVQQYDSIFSDKQKVALDLVTLKHIISEQKECEKHLEEQLEKTTGEFQSIKAIVDQLQIENNRIKEELAQKNQDIESLKQEHEDETNKNKVTQEQLEKLHFEINTKDEELQRFRTECDLLKQNSTKIVEKDLQISKLNNEIQEVQQLLTQLQIDKGNLELEKIDVSKQLSVSNQQMSTLKDDLTLLNKQSDVIANLTLETQSYMAVFEQLQLTEPQKEQLVLQMESMAKGENILALVKTIKIGSVDEHVRKVTELQDSLDGTRQELKNSKKQLQDHQGEILRLQDALTTKLQSNNNNCKSDHEQLLEEKQLAEGQIQFLNAIIVDIQRKNEEQKMRIELLESGFSPAAASELKLYGIPHGTVAPRMYCDICEEFDLHETEDCPKQGSDFDATVSQVRQKKTVVERSYCDICEVFGHSTEDCKEDETF